VVLGATGIVMQLVRRNKRKRRAATTAPEPADVASAG
jgi:hypothetical protein